MNRQAGGAAVSDHYAALERSGRKAKPKGPTLHPSAVHVWNLFAQVSAARTGSGFGPNPLTYSEIDAFSRLTGWTLDPWEVDAIRALDDAYITAVSEKG